MAKSTLPLTATQVKTAKAKEKDYKLFDGGGLFLLVAKTGGKRWRLKYRFNNKEKVIALGTYPSLSLKDVRAKREELKSLIAKDIDPNEQKKQKKEEIQKVEKKKENTFYKVSQEWHENYQTEVSENYHIKLGRALENYVYKYMKDKPIEDVTRLDLIEILKILKERDLQDTASRVFMIINKIYKYAVTLEYVPHNIVADIEQKNILGKREKKHYPTFTKEKDIKGLLLAIDEYSGDYTTKMALKMLPYVFVRSYNIRHCEWFEIDLVKKEWIIPASKMKTKIEFILPLPNQVIEILEEVKQFTGNGQYVFPSFRAKDKPMSDNTLIGALRRMGYTKEEFVPHSFRAMFSTIAYENMEEHGYSGEVIEALLSHKESNKVKEAYNRASYKDSMRSLIKWYANYLKNLKNYLSTNT
ncbi:integrase arm-type DNA-binding domain-containing protein [Poseidonibacter lekithochrous]|uniref:tyrosine-type recombinase/integrase n=1 Tax=Poseidonibacter TaxID=2321187 RepID=UPI001C08BA4E|nr:MULTISPECIES: integrase arm-type DNA-binding domain-containing protein [Poseidonibacter]MBU3015662.1 integrase arm-type DNA-binding domain-containing protein [Poseidonibacter lekithochrous]MDO6828963.1 integrase arm-type DNA-binding domain-containing protein [Poseidonibacter sp. 1_MG-2023]